MDKEMRADLVAKLQDDWRKSCRTMCTYVDPPAMAQIIVEASILQFVQAMGSMYGQLPEELADDAKIYRQQGEMARSIIEARDKYRRLLSDPKVQAMILNDMAQLFGDS